MIRETVLIDGDGRTWPSNAGELRRRLHAVGTDVDFSDYAVRNLGFVEVAGPGSMSCRVRLRPSTVGEAALGATLQLLSDIDARRVVVSHHESDWRHDFYRTGEEARDAITRLVLGALTGHAGCYRRSAVSPEELPSGNPLPEISPFGARAVAFLPRRSCRHLAQAPRRSLRNGPLEPRK